MKKILGFALFVVMMVAAILFALELETALETPEIDEEYLSQYEWTLEMPNEYYDIFRIGGIDNRFAAQNGIYKYGIIDCYGNEIIPFKYDAIDPKSKQGLYFVGVDAVRGYYDEVCLWGIISDNGEVIVEPSYGELKSYVGNHAIGYREGIWKVIDLKGNVLYENESELYSTGYHNIFKFGKDGITYAVNIVNGEVAVLGDYEDLPWEIEEVGKLNLNEPTHRVEEYNGMFGIVEITNVD